MPLYETVYIARQDISSQQVETLTEQMSAFITEGGGTVAKIENWGLRNLAYKVKKNRKGHYVLMNIDAPIPAVKEMERNLQLNEDVLRYMTIRVEELEEDDSVMLQSKGRSGNRRDREEGEEDKPKASESNSETKEAVEGEE